VEDISDDDWHQSVLDVVGADVFKSTSISMIAAGTQHSLALDDRRRVWTWRFGRYGALGHGSTKDCLLRKQLPPAAFDGAVVVQIATDANASMVVAADGAALWAWGRMPTASVRAPRRVETVAALGGALVCLAACAKTHFVVVASDGALWTWGTSNHGALGY